VAHLYAVNRVERNLFFALRPTISCHSDTENADFANARLGEMLSGGGFILKRNNFLSGFDYDCPFDLSFVTQVTECDIALEWKNVVATPPFSNA